MFKYTYKSDIKNPNIINDIVIKKNVKNFWEKSKNAQANKIRYFCLLNFDLFNFSILLISEN